MTTKTRTKVAVFDRFDWSSNPDLSFRTLDLNGEIDRDRHEVIAHANELGRAATILLAIKDGEIDMPDVIILGGMLDKEIDYFYNPHTMPIERPQVKEDEPQSGIRGVGKRLREKVQEGLGLAVRPEAPSHQFLLPVVDEQGRVTLPEVPVDNVMLHESSSHIRAGRDYLNAMYRRRSITALSGYVLAHMADHLLNADEKKVKIIGHSAVPLGGFGNAPLDAYVDKLGPAGRLQAEIDKEL
jgi:hypothetical protein